MRLPIRTVIIVTEKGLPLLGTVLVELLAGGLKESETSKVTVGTDNTITVQ